MESSFARSTNELKALAASCLSFGSHIKCLLGHTNKEDLVTSKKNVIAHCLTEDRELRTRGIKVTSAETIINNLQNQLKKLLESKLDSSSSTI